MVLIPCSDEWVAAVSGLKPALAERYPASIASPDAIDVCLDKGRLMETMMRLGLPHPRTIPVGPNDDIQELWNSLRDPFLKPRNTKAFKALYGTKALRVGTADEAMAWICESRQAQVEFLLQEYIPGSASTFYSVDGFVDRTGTVCLRGTRRRVRGEDKSFTDPSCEVSVPLRDLIEPLDILEQLLPALRYRGLFNAQFKYDERDGLFKLYDFNPRIWGNVAFPLSVGVNVVEMAYRDALGLSVERVAEYPAGRYWTNGLYDLYVCWRLFWQGQFDFRAWWRSTLGTVYPIFRWDDPLPAIVGFFPGVWHGIQRKLLSASQAP